MCGWQRTARIAMIRSAIVLHSARHWSSRAASLSRVLTMRAPVLGGEEYMGRMMIFSCERTREASSSSPGGEGEGGG